MLELLLYKYENKLNFFYVFLISFFIILLLSYINSFIGGTFFFLLSFTTLFLAYPFVKLVIKNLNSEIIKKYSIMSLIFKNISILIPSFAIFISSCLAFFLALKFGLIFDSYYQEKFLNLISGKIIDSTFFLDIFLNNLKFLFYTFLISFVSIAGFLFMVIWNSSIISYFIFTKFENNLNSLYIFISLLPHGLFEIGGYFLGGISGVLLSFLFNKKYLKLKYEKNLFKDFFILFFLSIFLIFIGAILESVII